LAASLRTFVETLKQRGRLLTVEQEVDPKFEVNAVIRKIQEGPNLPVLFKNVKGCNYQVLSNTLGNLSIIADILNVERENLACTWADLTWNPTLSVDKFETEEVEYEEVKLTDIPHIIFSEKDAGPYLTASVIIARDPETNVVNLSYHRMQIAGPAELRCRLSTSGDLYRIHQKMEKRGQPLKAVVAIGLPPAVMLAAATTIGPMTSEYDFAERIAGKKFPYRTAAGDLPVPATTEFIIEGEILPSERRPEGPFGEWMDYYVPEMNNHVFMVERVLARKNALFYAISAGSLEEIAMTAVPIAGLIFHNVRTWVAGVKDVTCFPLLQFCAIKIDKQSEGQPQRAMLAAFGAEMNRVLYCVVVDEDVDIHNWSDVLWAMATRCRPDRDILQIPGVPSFARDPHKMHWGRLGIDATKPLEHVAAFERKKTPGLRDINLQDYITEFVKGSGLPHRSDPSRRLDSAGWWTVLIPPGPDRKAA
jgi:UbiD family decarboxylase